MNRLFFIPSLLFLLYINTSCNADNTALNANVQPLKHKEVIFNDKLLEQVAEYPSWFKQSFGDLSDDLKQAKDAGKIGIITYFGQSRCAYCQQFFQTSLANKEIKNYLTKYYDVIALNIWSTDDIIDTDGETYSERSLSIHYNTNFTPSLIFYDQEGVPVFRLRGFYPPYKFRAALQYVTEGFYKKEIFADYFLRATQGKYFLNAGLNERDFFLSPPYQLNKLLHKNKATAVFFEQGNCHACDLLHSGPLSKKQAIDEIKKMNIVQLNMWKDTAITTPSGEKTSAKKWAKSLHIFYTPSIVFFDDNGKEIIRVDSVTQFYRLLGVLNYVNKKGYKNSRDYQDWRLKQREVIK